MIKITFPLIG